MIQDKIKYIAMRIINGGKVESNGKTHKGKTWKKWLGQCEECQEFEGVIRVRSVNKGVVYLIEIKK